MALAGTAAAPAGASPPPYTYRATTRVDGTALPQPTATGGWTAPGKNTAVLDVTVANAAPAQTSIEASWTSPLARSRGRCFGQLATAYRHDAQTPPGGHVTNTVRYRVDGGRWSRWFVVGEEDFEIPPLGMGVEHGLEDDCVLLFDRAPRRPLQLELRHVIRFDGTLRGRDELTVSVP